MAEIIIGISAFYHDSAACIVKDGEIIAAAQEERFTRRKHDSNFPIHALQYVIDQLDVDASQINHIAFYDKPLLKLERLLETYHAFVPKGWRSFFMAIPVWLKEKLFIKQNIRRELKRHGLENIPLLFPEHHLSHAASAFFPSPFDDAAILTVDGVGEWTTTTIGHAKGNSVKIIREIHFPHSLGLLYSAFTYYCGFRVNSGEYKLMGLAPYGQPESDQTKEFHKKILEELIDVREDGSFVLNMKYFHYATGLKMTNNQQWTKLFGMPPRKPESPIDQEYCNMALAIQQATEEIILQLAKTAREITGSKNLVMAGGVALNSVANGKLERSKIFEKIWIQPAAGDAGGSVGAALATYYIYLKKERVVENDKMDGMKGALLGPDFDKVSVKRALSKYDANYHFEPDMEKIFTRTAQYLKEGKIVGWFQGRMEFGPRALGNRSILGDARNKEMQKRLNLQIKFRESFRPFAPAVMSDSINEFFDTPGNSPYMLIVCPVKKVRQIDVPNNYHELPLMEKLYFQRSDIPAVTHIDYSARIQSVHQETNPEFYGLISKFRELTGYGVIINTSFNVRGEPIVCTPEDAFVCFMRTDMDVLIAGNYILLKEEQKEIRELPRFDYLSTLD